MSFALFALFHFISILLQLPRARYRSFYCFMQFTRGIGQKIKKKNLTTFAAISTPYRQLLLCRSCFLLRLLSCITIKTIIVALPTHMISSQLKRTCLSFNWDDLHMKHYKMFFPNTRELFWTSLICSYYFWSSYRDDHLITFSIIILCQPYLRTIALILSKVSSSWSLTKMF